jgi:hypothetical protein
MGEVMNRLIFIMIIIPALLHAQDNQSTTLTHLDYFIGHWIGSGEGKWGSSSIEREYKYIMSGTFLLGMNKSVYEKQEKNLHGEIHDNWDIFSFDQNRKKYVLRQFHAEDMVNQYVADSIQVSTGNYEFISESIENFGNGWRAKELYEILNNNEFVERFYLAAPDKEFSLYVTNHFKRKKK